MAGSSATFLDLPPEIRDLIYELSGCLCICQCTFCNRHLRGDDERIRTCFSHDDRVYRLVPLVEGCSNRVPPLKRSVRFCIGSSPPLVWVNRKSDLNEPPPKTRAGYAERDPCKAAESAGTEATKKLLTGEGRAADTCNQPAADMGGSAQTAQVASGAIRKDLRKAKICDSNLSSLSGATSVTADNTATVEHPALTQVSKQVRADTLPMFYGRRIFVFTLFDRQANSQSIVEWLARIGDNADLLLMVAIVCRKKADRKYFRKVLRPMMEDLGLRDGVTISVRLEYPFCYCERCILEATRAKFQSLEELRQRA
ncbi:hypothetical protein B0A50_03147 [Salinomyces thailandicus]|uniref:Uncharacterized protein n=1 Tax=Salinomyces thailandicus TaxID=706561 RepID=A0A4U0U3Y2_9PEZI|nr:hypothetical protein B0A50_03147 [Salinomyces thailandica]